MQIKDKKVIALGGVLLFFLLVQFFFLPTFKRTRNLNKRLKNFRGELSEIKRLKKEYLLRKEYLDFSGKKKNFSFYSLLEKIALSCGVKENIVSLVSVSRSLSSTYKSVGLEIRLEGIELKKLTEFLTGIENAQEPIAISRLLIEQEKTGLLKVTVEIVTVQEVS